MISSVKTESVKADQGTNWVKSADGRIVPAAKAVSVRFDKETMWVTLADGRILGVPLAWFPRLLAARAKQRSAVRLSACGLHWDNLDEDISIAGLLSGYGAAMPPKAA